MDNELLARFSVWVPRRGFSASRALWELGSWLIYYLIQVEGQAG
jgi:hypothetical protein